MLGKESRRPFAFSRRRSWCLEALEDRLAPAITIQINYSHDTSGFFANNPAARTALNEAAQSLGSQLNNVLPAIAPSAGNSWSASFFNPSNPYGADLSAGNLSVPANTIVVYAGGADLGGAKSGDLGTGAPGGYTAQGTYPWLSLVAGRGQAGALATPPTGVGIWGGSVSFDETTDWSFSGTPGPNQEAFYPVALVVLTQVLGIGTAGSWFTHVNATNHTFTGPHAEATPIQIGTVTQTGPVPLYRGGPGNVPTGDDNWASGLLSGGNEPLMDIDMGMDQTPALTPLDWAGLADVGWSVDHLAVSSQPAADVTAGSGFDLTVSAEDPDGAVDTLFSGKVTIKLAANPGAGKLGGTLTATAVDGVATFSGITLNHESNGYTLTAGSPGLPGATSGSFDVIPPGLATQLAVTTQPAGVTADSPFNLVVKAEDGLGNVDSIFNGSVTIALSANPSGGTLGGILTATAVNGVATFTDLKLDTAGAGYQIQAVASTLAPATSTLFSVAAGQATQLVIASQPPGSVLVNNGFGLTVQAEDGFGNVVSTFNGSVTLSLNTGPVGATLGGTRTIQASNGAAVFTGLTVNVAGSDYSLQARSSGLSAKSSAFDAATTVAPTVTIQFDYSEDSLSFFASHPQAKTVLQEAGQILGSQLHDSLAAITPSGRNTWMASFLNPSDPTASYIQLNNLTIPANTIVVFVGGADMASSALTQDSSDGWSGSGSTAWLNLLASRGQAGALTDPATDFGPWGGAISFNENANWSFAGTDGSPGSGQVDFLSVALQQLGAVLGVGTSPSWADSLDSKGDNFIRSHAEAAYGGPVPTTGTAWAAGLTSAGQEPLFDMVVKPGERRQLTPLDLAGLADIGWSVDQLAVMIQPPAAVSAGSGFQVAVSVEGPGGGIDASFNGLVTLSLGNNPGNAVLGGTLTVRAVDGVATFSGLTLSRTGAGFTLLATTPGGSSVMATTNPISVIAGQATHFVVTTQPPASITAASGFVVAVTAEDALGNVASTFSGPVTIAITASPGTGTLGGTLTVTAIDGVATFNDLTLDKVGLGYTLHVDSNGLSGITTKKINVMPGAATQLVVVGQPTDGVAAGGRFGLVVQAEDAEGNVVPTFAGSVTLTLANNPGGSTLGGKLTVAAVRGVASFTGLTLSVADPGYTLTATAAGLTAATTTGINVAAGTATQLVVRTQPPGVLEGGSAFGFVVWAEDSFGNLCTTYNGAVTVALASSIGAALSGKLTVHAVGGVATFTGLTVNNAASDFQLKAIAAGLSKATTNAIALTSVITVRVDS